MGEDYWNKTKEINDKLKADIKSVNDEYNNALISRLKSINDTYSMFDNFNFDNPVDETKLIPSLQNQVVALENFKKTIDELSFRGVDSKSSKRTTGHGTKIPSPDTSVK